MLQSTRGLRWRVYSTPSKDGKSSIIALAIAVFVFGLGANKLLLDRASTLAGYWLDMGFRGMVVMDRAPIAVHSLLIGEPEAPKP